RRHTRFSRDWSSDVCSSDLGAVTGLYTSPHLCTFRERIQVDGVPIGEEQLVAAVSRLWPHIKREEPSFFEATTAIAFLALADAEIGRASCRATGAAVPGRSG